MKSPDRLGGRIRALCSTSKGKNKMKNSTALPKFKVGDRCVIVGFRFYPELLGAEVTITGPLQLLVNSCGEEYLGYPTDLYHKGCRICPRPHYLRKKRALPGKRLAKDFAVLSSWDKVGWTPKREVA